MIHEPYIESTSSYSEDPLEDLGTGYGQLILFGFTAAVLFVTGTVAILCFVTSWWMLGLVFGMHLLVTAGVSYLIARVLTGQARSQANAAKPAVAAGRGPTSPAQSPVLGVAASR